MSLVQDPSTGTGANVKNPSTAPVATDAALVVTISPNSSAIATTNLSAAPPGGAPPADATYVGGLVTTSTESGLTSGDIYPLSLTTTGLLRIDGSNVTQPVSGTVTANAGTGTFTVAGTVTANQGGAPWSQNITQFGGTNISTGTGVGGIGIPRVTVSNDSNILATQSGTWTVQPGNTPNSTPWLVTDSSDGPVTPGTVAGKSSLVGGQFNTSLPTLSNTQQSAIQLDSSGRVIISSIPAGANVIGAVTQSGVWTTTVTQPTASNLNATVVGSGNFTVVQATASNLNATVTASGNFNNASVGVTASTPPADATYVGGLVTTVTESGLTNGDMYALSLTTTGLLRVDGSNVIQPVSGTVTANQGGAWTVAATQSGTWTNVVTQVTAANLNATVVGTTAAGSGSSSGLVTIQGNAGGTPVPVTGTITAINLSVGATAAAPPSDATYVGGLVTTAVESGLTNNDMYPLSLTTTGLLRVDGSNVIQPVSGTVTANAGTGTFTVGQATAANLNATVVGSGNFTVVQATASNLNATVTGSVTANIGTTNGLALDTSVNGILVAQASATSGEKGPLVQGAVTTSSPTYTTGQTDPLSLTTAGALRIDGSAVTQPVSGTVTSNQGSANTLANAWSTKITDATNGPAAVKPASTAAVATDPALVVAISPNSNIVSTSGTADVTATGALGALNATVQLTIAGHSSAGFQLASGTLIGTIVAESSFDGGATWNSTYIDQSAGNKVSNIVFASANTATASTIVGTGGSGLVRVRVSAYTSGTANITLRASIASDPSTLTGGQPNATVQPPDSTQISGWDGTTLRVPVVKAASTAAVATDQALVVTLSPNSHTKSNIQPLYGASGQAVTITLASLANAAARASTVVSNTTNLYEDVYLFVKITTAASGVSATGYVNVYGYGTVDGGTNYPEAITGTDAGVTLTSPPNLALLAQINANTSGATKTFGPFSFCRLYGLDRLPASWGVVVVNETGAAFNATAGNFLVEYQGVSGQLA